MPQIRASKLTTNNLQERAKYRITGQKMHEDFKLLRGKTKSVKQ